MIGEDVMMVGKACDYHSRSEDGVMMGRQAGFAGGLRWLAGRRRYGSLASLAVDRQWMTHSPKRARPKKK